MQWIIDHSVLVLTCVTTFATLVYGVATFLLWLEIRQDRKQREKQFNDEKDARKLAELHTAFYDAWGHWEGHRHRPSGGDDTSQAGRLFEALIRLECLLRLNGYKTDANNFGLAVRTLTDVEKRLSEVGQVLGLVPSQYPIPPEYRRATPATVTPAKPTA